MDSSRIFENRARHFAASIDRPIIILSLITILAALLRLYHLGFKSLWLDEAILYWLANGNLKQILEQNALYNSAPPLFPLLLRAVISINTSEPALRMISCLAGIAAVPAMYLLAKEFVSVRLACFAALLVAVAPTQIQYSQQVREYSLTFLVAICAILIFCRFLKQQTWGNTLLLAFVLSLSVFTQYGLAILILAISLVFFLKLFGLEKPKRALALFVAAQVCTLVTVLAVYQLSLRHHFVVGGRAAYYLESAYWDGSLRSLMQMAVFNTQGIFDFAFPTSLMILACAFGIAEVFMHEQKWTAVWLLIVPIALTFIMATLRAYPYLGARQIIFLTPMIYVFAALGIAFLARLQNSGVAIAIFGVLMICYGLRYTASYYMKSPENIRPIVSGLLSSVADGDSIYVYSGAVPAFMYYFRGQTRPWIVGVSRHEEPQKFVEQLDAITNQEKRSWLVFSHPFRDEIPQILNYISSRRRIALIREDIGAWLYLVQ